MTNTLSILQRRSSFGFVNRSRISLYESIKKNSKCRPQGRTRIFILKDHSSRLQRTKRVRCKLAQEIPGSTMKTRLQETKSEGEFANRCKPPFLPRGDSIKEFRRNLGFSHARGFVQGTC